MSSPEGSIGVLTDFAPEIARDAERPNLLLLPRDVEWRKGLYGPDVIQHPAKMQLYIPKLILDHYAQPGWKVMDPFAGTGTTALAATMGYPTTLIEIEDHFMELLKAVRRKWKEEGTIGSISEVTILQGDCRKVLPQLAEAEFDCIITSPPYSVTAQVGKVDESYTGTFAERKKQMHAYGSGGATINNIGRLNPYMFNQAMLDVYRKCLRVLKPGGLYVSVTKDSMKAGERQLLKMPIIQQATAAGFEYTGDWWKWKPPGGMMQAIMKSKGAEVVEDEDVIVFRRPV